MAMRRLNDVWDQLFPVERHPIANLMIERIDLVHAGERQGIKKVKWREAGWNALIDEFAPNSIGAELPEVRSLMGKSLETSVPLTFRRRGVQRVVTDERSVHDMFLLEGGARFLLAALVDTGVMKSGPGIDRGKGYSSRCPTS